MKEAAYVIYMGASRASECTIRFLLIGAARAHEKRGNVCQSILFFYASLLENKYEGANRKKKTVRE